MDNADMLRVILANSEDRKERRRAINVVQALRVTTIDKRSSPYLERIGKELLDTYEKYKNSTWECARCGEISTTGNHQQLCEGSMVKFA
jgi:hypothetical protein